MKTGKKRRALLALLLSMAFLMGSTMEAYANLDPSILGGNDSSDGDDYDDYDDDYDDDAEDASQEAETATQVADPTSKYQGEIDAINQKMEDLEKQKERIQAEISNIGDAREREIATRNYLDSLINLTEGEINGLEERIVATEGLITEKQGEIKDKQADIDDSYQMFKTRLRVMQLNDDTTKLGLILGSESFADFLTRTQTISRIAAHDQNLMEDLTRQRLELENAKVYLEEVYAGLEEDKAETERKKQELGVQRTQAQMAIHDMDQMEREYMADLEKKKAESAAMQKELEDIYRRIEWDKNPYVGGEMLWPLPNGYKITSQYGYRFNGSDLHTGIDMTYQNGGTHGATIVAANDGTVKLVNTQYVQGRGYGIYLIVDHGGGITTLYAHCSKIVVSEGQTVKRGEKIAEVGSTGWSTGPHLHFEVRVNGAHQAPLAYLQG